MKNIFAILILSVLLTFSCTKLEDLNENVKDPAVVPGESLFTSAQKQLVDQLTSSSVNFNIWKLIMQYWTEVTYTDESNYDLVTRTIPQGHWDELYKDVLKDFKEADKVIRETDVYSHLEIQKTNKLAIVEIMSVFTWSILVETFGDIPYSEALNIEILSPQYDDAQTIYTDLISRLNAAMAQLDVNNEYGSFGNVDNIYQGDVGLWIKFANSLKLRMGLLLADVNPTLAQTTVESAATAGVFTSNADNALFAYSAVQPNTNPIYVSLVASGRKDFIPVNTIVDMMNSLNDPRRSEYFSMYEGAYIGGDNGVENSFNTNSHAGTQFHSPTFPGNILDYAEVQFLLTEAVERGFNVGGGTAEAHYNNAVAASIEFWGGSPTEVSDYLAQAEVAYVTATGTWKQKIGTQKWLALYGRGFEAWTEWRKFDFPVLVAPPDAVSVIPVRYTYPITEQTLNAASYNAASTAIGGDDVGTRLFFDMQ